MASNYSFDIVSDFDRQELVNALDQARREISNRYDLKDTGTEIELNEDQLEINTDSQMTLQAVRTVLQTKATKRSLSVKIFDFSKVESASGSRVRQVANLQRGISQEHAKQIAKLIRDEFKKVQASIQGDAVRVSSKSKDDLQTVMQFIKQQELDLPLQFTNYR